MPELDRAPRVIHVLNTLNSGGLQRVVLALARWSRDVAGVESVLFTAGGPLESRVEESGATFVRKPVRGGLAAEAIALLGLVRRVRPDVLHAHQRHDATLAHLVGAIARVPVVEHAHNTLPDRRMRAVSFRSRRIFAVSDEVKQMVVEDFGRDPRRVEVVGGVPFNVSDAPPTARPALEPAAPRRILGIGRLEEQKDPERFIRVIAAASRLGAVEARWLGDGSLRGRCQALIDQLGAPVELVGESADVVAQLDASHGMLITSRWEGLGLVILEAFARRRPVVGLAVGGMGSLLGEGRGVSTAADASDEDLAHALWEGTSMTSTVEASVELAAEYVRARATPEAVYGPIVAVYREIVGQA